MMQEQEQPQEQAEQESGPMEAAKKVAEGMIALKSFIPEEMQQDFIAAESQVKEIVKALMSGQMGPSKPKPAMSGMSPEAAANSNARPVM